MTIEGLSSSNEFDPEIWISSPHITEEGESKFIDVETEFQLAQLEGLQGAQE